MPRADPRSGYDITEFNLFPRVKPFLGDPNPNYFCFWSSFKLDYYL